ncbi:MAG: outer membrane beta-barrel protein [Bacteroidia bacterium]|nr:outer membrane beta-barrel protein [Bacteroidia bacterium]
MKTNYLIIALVASSLTLFAGGKKGADNKWFTIGVRGTAAAPFLINSNEYKDSGIKHNFAFGGGGGAMLGFHFNDWGSINVECLYTYYSRKVKSAIDSLAWTSSTALTYLEIPILFRAEWNFKYVEGGIMFGSLMGATNSYTNDKFPKLNYDNKDIKDDVMKKNTAIVFGWGTNLMGSGGLMLSFGVRMAYGLSDIISDLGGKGKNYTPYSDIGKTKPASLAYAPTNLAYVGLHLSLDFDLGYFVSSNCGRKHEFQLFGH